MPFYIWCGLINHKHPLMFNPSTALRFSCSELPTIVCYTPGIIHLEFHSSARYIIYVGTIAIDSTKLTGQAIYTYIVHIWIIKCIPKPWAEQSCIILFVRSKHWAPSPPPLWMMPYTLKDYLTVRRPIRNTENQNFKFPWESMHTDPLVAVKISISARITHQHTNRRNLKQKAQLGFISG